ncbi:MAG: hypothetical protein E6G06_16575 [Actinobacteria bacterium]|nr:MAG: hypothetical protein E6G06_16575 [Actinomycetota bacterium]
MSVTAWSMRDAAVDVGHERVDDLLHVDALGLGHLGDGLATAQLVAQVGLADPDRLGDDRGLGAGREARAPAEVAITVGHRASVGRDGRGRRAGARLGPRDPGDPEHRTGHAAADEGARQGERSDQPFPTHLNPFRRVRIAAVTTSDRR